MKEYVFAGLNRTKPWERNDAIMQSCVHSTSELNDTCGTDK